MKKINKRILNVKNRSGISTRIAWLSIMVIMLACGEPNDTDPSVNFLKIYDDARFNASYIPIDIIQTEDEGFLILSGTRLESSDFIGVYILKVDKDGNFVHDIFFPETVVHPLADWLPVDDTYYFFAMDVTSLAVQLYGVSQGGNLLDPIGVNTTYPLHASVDGSNFILLSYDNESKSSILSTHETFRIGVACSNTRSRITFHISGVGLKWIQFVHIEKE